jgi:hypothetical protein
MLLIQRRFRVYDRAPSLTNIPRTKQTEVCCKRVSDLLHAAYRSELNLPALSFPPWEKSRTVDWYVPLLYRTAIFV